MLQKKQKSSAQNLHSMVLAAEQSKEFNIAADLINLQKQYGRVRVKEFKKILADLVDKYTVGENALVYEVLINKCKAGDIAALRLYHEMRKDSGVSNEEVTIIDDIK